MSDSARQPDAFRGLALRILVQAGISSIHQEQLLQLKPRFDIVALIQK
ncbi:hypothetical protein [Planococcus shenhongbingii]|uniref:Uncharacterized protein n=1 Tax=Planococcus shenhongbingii TaxID=3058398 RepID=A0ABT8N7Y8_9BACL|nr:hypothetical protein [Planococcus sp. N017]MDN7243999.1 hypothetical protein [Planococcus sp. N017]